MSAVQLITAAGGVLYRESASSSPPEVILIFRRGVWDLPKGKQEEDESVEFCAVREVAEEIGLSSHPHTIAPLPDTYHEYEQGDIHYGKTTHWFVMEQPEGMSKQALHPQTEEGIEKVQWVPLDEAIDSVGYDNLVNVLQSFARWYASQAD